MISITKHMNFKGNVGALQEVARYAAAHLLNPNTAATMYNLYEQHIWGCTGYQKLPAVMEEIIAYLPEEARQRHLMARQGIWAIAKKHAAIERREG